MNERFLTRKNIAMLEQPLVTRFIFPFPQAQASINVTRSEGVDDINSFVMTKTFNKA